MVVLRVRIDNSHENTLFTKHASVINNPVENVAVCAVLKKWVVFTLDISYGKWVGVKIVYTN